MAETLDQAVVTVTGSLVLDQHHIHPSHLWWHWAWHRVFMARLFCCSTLDNSDNGVGKLTPVKSKPSSCLWVLCRSVCVLSVVCRVQRCPQCPSQTLAVGVLDVQDHLPHHQLWWQWFICASLQLHVLHKVQVHLVDAND